jgi:hypothetical protein
VESKSIGQVVGIHGHLENGCWFNSPLSGAIVYLCQTTQLC